MKIKNVVVIGSGTMGSGIAAHLCNADIPVTLLDLKTEISENARERIHKSRPPLLIDKSKINNIKVGNITDDFSVVEKADWVVEAVVERIDIKHNIYDKIQTTRKNNSIISSNTSTIPLKILSANMSDEMKKNFCITHFFNPVRYMALLEIVTEEVNDIEKINLLKAESIADLISAETEIQRLQAVKIMRGKSSQKFNELREKLLKILSFIEAKIDFAEDDLPENVLKEAHKQIKSIHSDINKIINDNNVGEKIRDGFRVSIVGETNVGMGIDGRLLVDLADAFDVTDVAGVLTEKETRMWRFNLAMSFLFFLGRLKCLDLRLS